MSSSFCTTIGWGMPWLEFECATTLDCEIDRVCMDAGYQNSPIAPYLTANSLYSNIREKESDEFFLGEPDELFQVIELREDGSDGHVVFYPGCYHARLWRRIDDELDLALLYRTEDDGSAGPTGGSVRYGRFGHGPWRNYLMTLDGQPHDWVPFHELRCRKDLAPRVPLEMRSYLNRLGILDTAGINMLRPITASWIKY